MANKIVSVFNGLNNITDPLLLGMPWLARADNIDVVATGGFKKRSGYVKTQAGSFTGAYSTLDFSRMYVIDGGALKAVTGQTSSVTLLTGLAALPMYWCEVNENVFFNNGVDSGVIRPDHRILPWRAAPITDTEFFDADGALRPTLHSALPLDATVVQHWAGRIYAAQYMAADNQTVIWASQPLGFNLFALDTDLFLVPGEVTMLAPHPTALIVGTDAEIYAYNIESLTRLADYGVVPGQHWAKDEDRIVFWSKRGACAALPFVNLTANRVSVAPGLKAGGAIVLDQGRKRYVAALQVGGSSFNSLL